MQFSFSALREYLETHTKELGLFVLGVLIFFFGIFQFVSSAKPVGEVIVSTEQSVVDSLMSVDIEGAVRMPGVYDLPVGARIDDAIVAAGGYDDGADMELIAKTVNRAGQLQDGDKLYFPYVGDLDGGDGEAVVLSSQIQAVSINHALSTELERLSGIGPKTSQKIIENRPYRSINELVSRDIISQTLFDKLAGQLSL